MKNDVCYLNYDLPIAIPIYINPLYISVKVRVAWLDVQGDHVSAGFLSRVASPTSASTRSERQSLPNTLCKLLYRVFSVWSDLLYAEHALLHTWQLGR